MYKKEINGKTQLICSILIFAVFCVLSLILKFVNFGYEKNVVLDKLVHFIISGGLAILCYFLIRNSKTFATKICISKSTNVMTGLMWMVFLILLLLAGTLSNWIEIFRLDSYKIIACFLSAASAAVFEEFLVRGLMIAAFIKFYEKSKYQLLLTGISSALVFGLLHYYNLVSTSFQDTSIQVFYAAAIGMIFACIRIRYRNLWLPILIHFIIDFQPAIIETGTPGNSWITVLLLFTPIIVVSALVLFKMDRDRNCVK